MSDLVKIIIVAALGVLGNIAYFEYQTSKKSSKEILRERFTKLLLPLYVILYIDEKAEALWAMSENGDHADFFSHIPARVLNPAAKVIKENLFLADDELHVACINLLEWAHSENTNARYQEIMSGKFDFESKDAPFKKFAEVVLEQYEKDRHQYLSR